MVKSTPKTAGVFARQSRGKEKSIAEQVDLCTADAEAEDLEVTVVYREGKSASRYRRSERVQWPTVMEAVRAHEFDVLVMWVSSRGDRDLTSWSGLLDACRASGVLIRITDDERTYDVRRAGDWEALAHQGVSNASFSDKLSQAVKRGQGGAAKAGRPAHGRVPYGYRRTYNPDTGELDKQVPDDNAAIVREIIERLGKSEPVSTITDDLNTRGVPTAGAKRWYRQRVVDIARNKAYAGIRIYTTIVNGEERVSEHPAEWEPLVDEAVFWRAQAVLADPKRTTTRPGRQKHLLSYLALPVGCEGPLCAVRGRYRCLHDGCVTMLQAHADEVVERQIWARLRQPDVYEALRQHGDDADQEVVAAEAEAEKLQDDLDKWRRSAARGQTSPETMAVVEADLTKRIREAQQRAKAAAIPPALRELLEPGADVRARWAGMLMPARRQAIRAVAEVRIGPGVPGSRAFDRWRLGQSRWHNDSLTWADYWSSS